MKSGMQIVENVEEFRKKILATIVERKRKCDQEVLERRC